MANERLLNVNDYVKSASIISSSILESNSTNIFGYSIAPSDKRPNKKIHYYDVQVVMDTSAFEMNRHYYLYFGYMIQSGYITNLMFKNGDGTPWQNNKWHYFFGNIGCAGGGYVCPVVHFRKMYGKFIVELSAWRDGSNNSVSRELYSMYDLVINGDETEVSFKIKMPYLTYFTLDPMWNGYEPENIGYLSIAAPDYTDYCFNSYNSLAFATADDIIISYGFSLYDYFSELFQPFDENVFNENTYQFNRVNETLSQNDFIRQNATFLGYQDDKREGFGFVCNVLANDKTVFRGQQFYPTQNGDGQQNLKPMWMGRSYSPASESNFKPYQNKKNEKYNLDYFSIGGYYFYIFNEHPDWPKFDNSNNTLKLDDGQGNIIEITRDDFIVFPGSLAKAVDYTDPKYLITLFDCDSYEVYRDEDFKLKCKANMSLSYSEITTFLDNSKQVHIAFTKLVKVGKMSRNYINPPVATNVGNPYSENDWVYLIHNADGKGLNFNTSTGVVETLNFDFKIYKSLSGDLETDATFISNDTENKIFKFSVDVDLFNLFTVYDIRNMIKFPERISYVNFNITQDFGCYAYFAVGTYAIPMNPYALDQDEKLVELSKVLQKVYQSNEDNEYVKNIVKINGVQNEITAIKNKCYLTSYPLNGLWVELNVPGQIFMFRNMSIPGQKLKNVDDDNLFSLTTWYYYHFESMSDVPAIPPEEIIDFCPIESYNLCLLNLDSIGLELKYFSALYTSLNTDVDYIELERYVKYIPIELIEDNLHLSILDLLVGFGTTWI